MQECKKQKEKKEQTFKTTFNSNHLIKWPDSQTYPNGVAICRDQAHDCRRRSEREIKKNSKKREMESPP